MASQQKSKKWEGIRILKYSKFALINELLSSNIVWLLILIFLSLLVHNAKIQAIFDIILR